MYGLKHVTGIVAERRDLTHDLWIVRVRTGQKIPFTPGQYVTIGLPVGEKLVERPYSVVSSPDEPELEFFLEVVRGGKLTPQLYEASVGSAVYVRPAAKGRFTLDEQTGIANHFMVATVTGVAPFVSMVRYLAALAPATPTRRLAILHAGSVSAELAYREELEAQAGRRDWLRYVPTVSRPWLDPSWPGERGRAEDVARKHLDAVGFPAQSTIAYLCGNPHMIRNLEGILERAGFPKEHIRKEVYWPGD